MNRFKIKPAGPVTLKDKEDEEAAREINQRLARRLGRPASQPAASAQPVQPTTEVPAPPQEAPQEARFAVYNAPLIEGVISGDFHEEALRRPGPDGEPAYIDPDRVQVQTITTEITRDIGGQSLDRRRALRNTLFAGLNFVDTVTLTTTRTLPGPDIEPTASLNDLDGGTIQETPPIVISRTYSLTERSSRTSLLPVVDGGATTTYTVTENFVINKVITAYKTMPGGDLALLETAMLHMNDSNYLENLTEEGATAVSTQIAPSSTVNNDQINPTANDIVSNLNQLNPGLLQPSIQPTSIGPQVDLNNPLVLGAALQNPALVSIAIDFHPLTPLLRTLLHAQLQMYFGLQQLGQQATQLTTITKPTQYVTSETIFNTKVISFYDGRNTRTRTITEAG